MQHIVDRHALRLGDGIGGRFAEMLARLPPDLREERAPRGFLGPEVFVGLRAGEEVQALPGAGGGDVEEAAAPDFVVFFVEPPYILVGRKRARRYRGRPPLLRRRHPRQAAPAPPRLRE